MKRGTFLKSLVGVLGVLSVPKEGPKTETIEEMELYQEGQYVTTEAFNKIPHKINEIIGVVTEVNGPMAKVKMK